MTNPAPPAEPRALDAPFVRRVLFVLAAASLFVLVLRLGQVMLLAFTAVLIAVLFRAVSEPIRDRFGLPDRVSLLIAVFLVLGVLGGSIWLFLSQVGAEFVRLPETLPAAVAEVRRWLEALPFGDQLVQRLEVLLAELTAPDTGKEAADTAQAAREFFTALGATVGQVILVFVAGLYLAIRPQRYRDGVIVLVPPRDRERVREALNAAGRALKLWLIGTIYAMIIVGVLTWLGLWLVGVPSAAALGVLAGLGEFVPIVGPSVTAVPGLLLALQEGPTTVLLALGVYVLVQQVEGNFIVPLIQKKMVDLPPFVTVFSIVVFAVLFGPLGVVFAVPLAVVVFVLVKALYVRDVLGDPVDLPRKKPRTPLRPPAVPGE